MIVREIKDNEESVMKSFDWFNDYDDTRLWAMGSYPSVIPDLDAGFKKWLHESNKRTMEQSLKTKESI